MFSFLFSFTAFTYQPSVHSVLIISLSAMSSACMLFILYNWKALRLVNSSLNSATESLCLYLTIHKVTHALVKKCGLPCLKNNSPSRVYAVVSCNMLQFNFRKQQTLRGAQSRPNLHVVSFCCRIVPNHVTRPSQETGYRQAKVTCC
jgi:hypothetical protein